MTAALVIFGLVAVAILAVGIIGYSDSRDRFERRLSARLIVAAPVWPAAVVFIAVRAVPGIVRAAFGPHAAGGALVARPLRPEGVHVTAAGVEELVDVFAKAVTAAPTGTVRGKRAAGIRAVLAQLGDSVTVEEAP